MGAPRLRTRRSPPRGPGRGRKAGCFTLTDDDLTQLGEQGLFVRDGFLTAADVRALRDEVEASAHAGLLRQAGIRRGENFDINAAVRGDEIAWLDSTASAWAETTAVGWALTQMEQVREALNERAWLGLARMDVQAARYRGDGARYSRHLDAFRDAAVAAPSVGGTRRVTAIVYANPDWSPDHGGALRAFLTGGERDIEPLGGRLVVFLSEKVEHEVLPTFAPRIAVTAWFYGPDDVLRGER